MAEFKHVLWGYALTYPDEWTHQTMREGGNHEVEVFQASPERVHPGYDGPLTGQVAVRAEWNPALEPIEPLWTRVIGLTAGMMGAAKVGSAPWKLRDAVGMEAEIVLPKRENTRLWTGILARGALVLHFAAIHPKEERKWFEPYATRLIASLRFPAAMEGVAATAEGLPLPPGCSALDPRRVISDIADPTGWQAFDGAGAVNALQAFYFRELIARGWQITDYQPFPPPQGREDNSPGFARLQLQKEQHSATLGIIPIGEERVDAWSPAVIVIKSA